MKVTLFLAIISLMAFQSIQQKEVSATPRKVSGVAVFLYSDPVGDYELVESGKFTILMDCNEAINKPIKKAAKLKADGVIIHFEQSRYDIIKFK